MVLVLKERSPNGLLVKAYEKRPHYLSNDGKSQQQGLGRIYVLSSAGMSARSAWSPFRPNLTTFQLASSALLGSYIGSTAMPGIYVKCPKCRGVGTVQPSGNTCDMCKGSGMVEVK